MSHSTFVSVHLIWAAALICSISAFGFSAQSSRTNRCPQKLQAAPSSSITTTPLEEMKDEYDVIVIGSGIGGLSSAAMLSLYGYSVAVLESHYSPGGAAHGFSVKHSTGAYHFDTGPSFFSGLNPNLKAKASNPLRTILDAIGESVECVPYTSFGLKFPEGDFLHTVNFGGNNPDAGNTQSPLEEVAGPDATAEWQRLMDAMKPLAKAVDAMPTAALRGDLSALVTVAPFLKNFALLNPLENLKLTQPYSNILDQASVKTPFTRNWLDLLCFCLSGLPANGTITAEMALMMGEFYDRDAIMDCPKGGANAIVDALVRGITKHGGQVFCNSHVQQILLNDNNNNRATGVRLKRKDRAVTAKQAVVSNLSVWDLLRSGILETSALPSSFVQQGLETPLGKSFMHLHIGFQATKEELDRLQAHYLCIEDWSRGVEAQDNAVLISIPSVHDNSLAPAGHAVLHAYTPATEEYERWTHLRDKRQSLEYQQLKEERSQYLWKVLEDIIPDIRERATVVQVGTPLTHERFLRRHAGSYGPAIVAGEASFPFPKTPLSGLLLCGDSCFPGIGVPAVAGSGLLAAHSVSLSSIPKQQKLLEKLQQQ
ncbi:Prolycopene isomerase, chloroplastic [Seminavis robusta]|uniref:Prolycopene isomerase, chloroplastic n=1 Tax=Seminavis robusta TaxID=568900 RepID=A0A9N8H8M9_9STRA|nr:Prolycopene isomerase, chloroplastic [Seminavis robusta]|eukprot:Sro175_g076960.1 Prolycopene isomerase, chloroplastic (597) ;mRNA; r:31670-33460